MANQKTENRGQKTESIVSPTSPSKPQKYDEIMAAIRNHYCEAFAAFIVFDVCNFLKEKDTTKIQAVFDFAVAHDQMEFDEFANVFFLPEPEFPDYEIDDSMLAMLYGSAS